MEIPERPCLHSHFTAAFGTGNQYKAISWSFFTGTHFPTLGTLNVVKLRDPSTGVTGFPTEGNMFF